MLITDGSDLEGVTRVQDIKYMRYLRIVLRPIGAWPGHEIGEPIGHWKKYGILMIANTCMLLLGEVLYVKNSFNRLSFADMVNDYITVFMTIICVARSMTIYKKQYSEIFKGFITDVHLFNGRKQSAYAMKTHLSIHKYSHFFTFYMICLLLFGDMFFSIVPIIMNIRAGGFKASPPKNLTYELSVNYALPFDYHHNFNGYIVVSIFNFCETLLAADYFCIIDSYMGLLMFHLWGHLKIIVHDLDYFPRPRNDSVAFCGRYTDEELLQVREKLKSIAQHHNRVLKYIKDVQETFGPAIALSYGFYQVTLCILLFGSSQQGLQGFIRYAPMTVALLSLLIQMSLTFELVGSMRDQLINSVYGMPWECMDVSNRKSVLIILQLVQRPLGLKAVGMVEVGCNTMMTILKTSISYFAMLRTMAVD
ncbi:uncharacterized protein LOC128682902 [Plodia interpunctella]|uniref:uncharacterized protein LOC128682902 n=1 Tax=Plodia interpunctella TaxID=58824 RepID=UPI0023677564|nr:uncharacterized protein LOC128682902 [Plodia interpunctella]